MEATAFIPLGMGAAVIGAGLGIGKLAAAAAESIARQPEAASEITAAVNLPLFLLEGVAIIALALTFATLFFTSGPFSPFCCFFSSWQNSPGSRFSRHYRKERRRFVPLWKRLMRLSRNWNASVPRAKRLSAKHAPKPSPSCLTAKW